MPDHQSNGLRVWTTA